MDLLEIFQLCENREDFARFRPLIKTDTLGDAAPLFEGMCEYFDTYPLLQTIVWDEFWSWFVLLHGGRMLAGKRALYEKIIARLTARVHRPVYQAVVSAYVARSAAQEIADISTAIAEGREPPEVLNDVQGIVDEALRNLNAITDLDSVFATSDIQALADKAAAPGYEWRLDTLNVSAGPLRPADFVVLGARPESGKTTFLAAEASYFAEQLTAAGDTRPILWVNNEEEHSKVLFRIMQAALGITSAALLKDLKASEQLFEKRCGKGRFLVTRTDREDMNTAKAVEQLCLRHDPAIIIFDTLDKVAGFAGQEGEHMRLGMLYKWARGLAAKYGPVIAASQADASADAVDYIGDAQLRGSKTDKIGEADLIVTIGNPKDPNDPDRRGLHLPKNKLFGGARTKPELRHGFFQVRLLPEIARYEAITK